MLDITETREKKKAQRTKKKDWRRVFPEKIGQQDFANEPSAGARRVPHSSSLLATPPRFHSVRRDTLTTVGTTKSDFPDNNLCANGVWFDRSLGVLTSGKRRVIRSVLGVLTSGKRRCPNGG
jgi:hypothetical protein